MELHGENPYKIRSYQNAYISLRKLGEPLETMGQEEIEQIKGVGKAISGKIRELLDTGKMETLERYRTKTPPGVQEMLAIKGFGPKKVRVVWEKLGVESPGELLYAVNENRLLDLKGFGKKTQEDLRKKLEYYLRSRDQFHFATMDAEAAVLEEKFEKAFPGIPRARCGALRRAANVLSTLEFLLAAPDATAAVLKKAGLEQTEPTNGGWKAKTANGLPVQVYTCAPDEFGSVLFQRTGSEAFLHAFQKGHPQVKLEGVGEEAQLFGQAGLSFIPPELRESDWALEQASSHDFEDLVSMQDIRGVVHSHTTDSDGMDSLLTMAEYARDQGFAYILITDHSKSAFYANGLSAERLLKQGEAIDELNRELAPFRIFKGIESDILADGSLDYDDEVLATLDVVIASVHSNLRMDETKATQRLLRAIENPYTKILGHPTGRLLLSRPGYPIDHASVIDACAERGVVIELNANPWRLDLDWSWIPYAMEQGVRVAINPDAHSTAGIHDIRYGVISARKGGLTRAMCLNSLDADGFAKWCGAKKG